MGAPCRPGRGTQRPTSRRRQFVLVERDVEPRLLRTVTEHGCGPASGKFALAFADESYGPSARLSVSDPILNVAVPPLP